ncbi:hypothetical protein H0H81_002642 [Sphagnurus paluster]|uniref:Uncharacterized protein n=1 Tax=Sphagnurus paluster TaxID=117069 RepID=A0A9P7KPG2_9AGAR|nr:hypothetical protein H0H81_002642 [Sphagnurus paluster]
MVKQLEHDLLVDFPQFADIQATQTSIVVPLLVSLIGTSEETPYGVKEQLMANTWLILQGFSEVLDLPASRASMTPAQRLREGKCILCNYWPDLVIMYKYPNGAVPKSQKFYGDFGLPKEFRPFLLDKKRPKSWALLFSCQVMLDTVHTRRVLLDVDLKAMRTVGRSLSSGIETFLNSRVLYDSNMDVKRELAPGISEGIKQYLLDDFLTRVKVSAGWQKQSMQACQPDSLWRQNPWLVANAMTDALMDRLTITNGAMGAGGFLQSAIHLWNMLKVTGHLRLPQTSNALTTADVSHKNEPHNSKVHLLLMENMVSLFGDKVFSGPPPTDPARLLSRFELMLGVRPEEFAAENLRRERNGPRAHNPAGRGVSAMDSVAWNLHDKDFALQKLPGNVRSKANATLKPKPEEHPLTYVQKLVESELGHGVRETTGPLLNLDILKIHDLCVRLFGELNDVLKGDLERVFNRPYSQLVPTQIQWPMITGWVARSGEPVVSGGKGINVQLLKKAGEVTRIVGKEQVSTYLVTGLDLEQ